MKVKLHKKFDLWINIFVFILIIAALIAESMLKLVPFETSIKIVLGLISGYFVFHAVFSYAERIILIEETQKNFSNLIESVGVLRIIKTPREYYQHLIGSIEEAEDSVCLIYLTKKPPFDIGAGAQEYWEWFQDYVAKRSRKVAVKRIASLDCQEKIEWLKCKTLELANIPNYSVRGYNPDNFLPLMGMEIIDRKKVFIFGPHGNTPRWIYIENPDVAEGMAQYFEKLWGLLDKFEIKGLNAIVSEDSFNKKIESIMGKEVNG